MITKEHLTQLLSTYPLLHAWGYGYPDRKSKLMGLSYIEENKPELFDRINEINIVVNFLEKHATETKRITNKTSYGLKHLIEEYTGEYMTNGAFIAGALLVGYRMKKDPGYNPCFNMKIDPLRDQ